MEISTIKTGIQGVLTSAFCSFLKEHFRDKSSTPAHGWILGHHYSMCKPGSPQMMPDKRVRLRNSSDIPQPLKGIQAPSQIRNGSKQPPLPTHSLVTESLAPAHESWYRVAFIVDNFCWSTDPREFISKKLPRYSSKKKRYSPGWQKAHPPSNGLNLSLDFFLCLTRICKGEYSPHCRIFPNMPILPRIISHMAGKRLPEKS